MRSDIEHAVNNCDECLKFNIVKTGYHPLRPLSATLPGDHLQMDFAYLPRSRDNYRHLLVITDVFSGFVILRALAHDSAESVATTLLDVISLIGPPRILQSDRGSEFVNAVIDSFSRLTGIERRLASAYHPQTEGKVERAISSVKSIIYKMLKGSFEHWPLFVPFVQLSYNARISRSTGSSPFVLFFGRPLNELRNFSTAGAPPVDLNSWKEHQRRLLSVVYPSIALKAAHMSKQMQQAFERRRSHSLIPNLSPGTVVTLKDPAYLKDRPRPSHMPKYDGNRYVVVKQTQLGTYVLRDLQGNVLDRRVPIDQMKLVRGWRESDRHEGDVYDVERLLDHHHDTTTDMDYYLVKWKGYDQASWEPKPNILDTRLMDNYHKYRKTHPHYKSKLWFPFVPSHNAQS
jgi:transposase InsO family protein